MVIVVPDLMISYLLNLYNSHDFNGIMRSSGNMLGTRIYELIDGFGDKFGV